MDQDGQMHHRLFAKFLMFVTLLLGGLVGYFAGFYVGQANAVKLLHEGELSSQTEVTSTPSAVATVDPKVAACYEETLGAERYAVITSNTDQLTVDEVFKLLPCTTIE